MAVAVARLLPYHLLNPVFGPASSANENSPRVKSLRGSVRT
jgi:hypothetical protein